MQDILERIGRNKSNDMFHMHKQEGTQDNLFVESWKTNSRNNWSNW